MKEFNDFFYINYPRISRYSKNKYLCENWFVNGCCVSDKRVFHHKLIDKDGDISIVQNGLWQGTIVYMEICTNIDVNPNDVVENRTDIEAEFNEPFLESDELNILW